ncbi:MAG: hypothetical protein AB7T37_19245 [Dehalococcoidia bacterium]
MDLEAGEAGDEARLGVVGEEPIGQGANGAEGDSLAGEQFASNQDGVVLNDAGAVMGSEATTGNADRKTGTAISHSWRRRGNGSMGKGHRSPWIPTSWTCLD